MTKTKAEYTGQRKVKKVRRGQKPTRYEVTYETPYNAGGLPVVHRKTRRSLKTAMDFAIQCNDKGFHSITIELFWE